jgi:preprotein translocase SecE subunit
MEKFFKDRVTELHAVSWPTKHQATSAMITVLVIMLLVGLSLGFVDYILNEVILSLLANK